jgi:hypothetical protein
VGIGGMRYVVLCLERHRRKILPRDIFHFTPADRESREEEEEEEGEMTDEAFGSSAEK